MSRTEAPVSLVEFAVEHPDNRRRCILCTVTPDIERQAREGKAAGVTYRQIGQWLETVDPALAEDGPINKARLERHFQDDHRRSDG